jgi:hypothetical protein
LRGLVGILGLLLLSIVLWDAFETVILPRHVTRKFRLARLFFRTTWRLWTAFASRAHSSKRREGYLSYFGPLSMLLLLVFWAAMLMFSFALLLWASGSAVKLAGGTPTFRTDVYMSGTTFFTLGMGDVTPGTTLARAITVAEAGTGFGFLAIMIAYLPTLYGSFSQREVNISLLDARAGSPPTAGELLRRHGQLRIRDGLAQYLRDWELWSAQLMESHLTYPFLCFFRSQHDNQSWLAAFTAILDVCAALIAYGEGETKWQAQLTFAISRHAVADLSEVLGIKAQSPGADRLPPEDMKKIRGLLVECGVAPCSETGDLKLKELRQMYEPHLLALSRLLWMPVPPWGVDAAPNSSRTVWGRITSSSPAGPTDDRSHSDHF